MRSAPPIPVDTMKTKTLSFLAATLLASGCGRGHAPQLPPPATPMPPPVLLYSDNGGGIRDSTRVVIHDDSTYREYWGRATHLQMDPPQPTPVNFDREMVILVAAGRMTTNDQIHIDSLFLRKEPTPEGESIETLTIVVRTIEACRRMREDAFPLEIVRARKFEGPVKWDWGKDPQCRDRPAP